MATVELRAEPRTVLGKHVRRLRREGIVPGNIYGHGASRPIQAQAGTFEQMLGRGGRTSIVSIVVSGAKKETALVKGVQRDPRSGRLVHVDFQAVSMSESITTRVPLHFVGEAPAIKFGAVILHTLADVEVRALARDLPQSLEVDLSALEELHASIKVGDIEAPQGVTITTPADETVAIAQPPRVEREEAEEAAEEAAAAETVEAPAEPAAETESTEE